MDQKLSYDILTRTVGAEKVDELKAKFQGLDGSASRINAKMLNLASGAYLFEKAMQVSREAADQFFSTVEMGDSLQKMVEKTGIAAGTLLQFQEAARQANVPVDALNKYITKFNANIGNADADDFNRTLRSLNVEVTDSSGKLRASGDILRDVADRYAEMEAGPKKASINVALFGKAASDMIPILNSGSKGLDEFGLKISSEFPERAARFDDAVDALKKNLTETKVELVNGMLPGLQSVIDAFNKVGGKGSDGSIGAEIGESAKYAAGFLYLTASGIFNVADTVIQSIRLVYSFVKVFIVETWEAISGISKSIVSLVTLDFKAIPNHFSEFFKTAKTEAGKNAEIVGNLWDRLSDRSNEAYKFNLAVMQKTANESKKVIKNNTDPEEFPSAKLEKEKAAIEKFVIAQQSQISASRMQLENYAMESDALKKLTIAQDLNAKAKAETVGWTREGTTAMQAATDEIVRQRQELVDLERQQKQSFTVGAKTAVKGYIENLQDVATATKTAFNRAFQAMEDSIVSFVKTGKMNFQDFADAVIDSLIRIAVQQATLGIVMTAGMAFSSTPASPTVGSAGARGLGSRLESFANGGIMTAAGSVPLRKYASGGIASSPQLALYGEGSRPEAFVPLPDGRSIPVTMKGVAAGGGTFSIMVNVMTGEESSKASGDQTGEQLGSLIAAVVKTEIVKQMRPGGLLA